MTPEHLSSRLEGELRGKAPEEQWGILVEVRSYLLGEEGEEEEGSMLSPEDQAQYDAWTPSERQLEREWAQLMSNVPPEEADEVNPDFDRAPYEDRKRMVWDVRQYLAPHDEPDMTKLTNPATSSTQKKPPPPPRPPTDAELASVGPNEMRRRAGPNRGRDYERAMELGFDSRDADENGFRQDYYGKEKERRRGGGGSSYLAMGIACVLGTALVLLASAAALAEDGEPVGDSFMRLVRLS